MNPDLTVEIEDTLERNQQAREQLFKLLTYYIASADLNRKTTIDSH